MNTALILTILSRFFHYSLRFSETRFDGGIYGSFTVPNFLTISSRFPPFKMDYIPGKWPQGRRNLNVLRQMLQNTKQDITEYEMNIRELSLTNEMRSKNKETIKQYEFMIEELKEDYKQIVQKIDSI